MLRHVLAPLAFFLSLAASGALAQTSQPIARDLAEYREQHPTRLTQQGSAPPQWMNHTPLKLPAGAHEVVFPSEGLQLKAWLSDVPADGLDHPAIVFCHGGFAFGNDDWDAIEPLLKAGYVVMMPRWRGENDSPGEFQFYYGEVDDVNNAGKYLASVKGVDRNRLFVSGHSAGGSLAALAVMESTPFKLSAPIGAQLDIRNAAKWSDERHQALIVFDVKDTCELESRSALLFTSGLRAEVHLFQGKEDGNGATQKNFLALAHHFQKPASLTFVDGDHFKSLETAMPEIIATLNDYAPARHVVMDWPAGWSDATARVPHTGRLIIGQGPGLNMSGSMLAEPKNRYPYDDSLDRFADDLQRSSIKTGKLENRVDTPAARKQIGSRTVITYDTTGTLKGLSLHFRHWFCETPHYFIEVTAWTDDANFDAEQKEFDELLGCFHESDK